MTVSLACVQAVPDSVAQPPRLLDQVAQAALIKD
jgi:hypothetical protein